MMKCNLRSVVRAACLIVVAGLILSCAFGWQTITAMFREEFNPTHWVLSDEVPPDFLRIRVVDQSGMPVDGAFVGSILQTTLKSVDENPDRPNILRIDKGVGRHATLGLGDESEPPPVSSDGVVDIDTRKLPVSDPRWEESKVGSLYIVHPGRMIGALVAYKKSDLGSETLVELRPLSRIQGKVTRADDAPLKLTSSFAFWGPPQSRIIAATCGGWSSDLDLLLPAGEYTLFSSILIKDEQSALQQRFDAWDNIVITSDGTTKHLDMVLTEVAISQPNSVKQ